MSILDVANNLEVEIVFNTLLNSDTTSFTDSVDMSNFNNGFVFTMGLLDYANGNIRLSLQDSPDDSVWTDVPAEKINRATDIFLTAGTPAGAILGRIGAFSTNKFVRGKVISTGSTNNVRPVVFVVKDPEQKPI